MQCGGKSNVRQHVRATHTQIWSSHDSKEKQIDARPTSITNKKALPSLAKSGKN